MQNTENEEFEQCPFVASHSILKQHFAVHLVRCKRQHKNSKLMLCPFNATHFMEKEELEEHVKICPSRHSFESFSFRDPITARSQPQPPQPAEWLTTEDWSDDPPEESYNPAAYAASSLVVRSMQGGSKNEKKKFRMEERARLLKLRKMQ